MTDISDRLAALGIAPIGHSYVPLSAPELEELTDRLGSGLPADYVEFASTYGRCRLDATVPTVDGSHEFPLDEFLGGGQDDMALLAMHEEYADRFPAGAFPIATNLLGDLFLLWVTDPELPGSVWYASYYSRSWLEPEELTFNADGTWRVPCYLAARSFTDVLARAEAAEETQ